MYIPHRGQGLLNFRSVRVFLGRYFRHKVEHSKVVNETQFTPTSHNRSPLVRIFREDEGPLFLSYGSSDHGCLMK